MQRRSIITTAVTVLAGAALSVFPDAGAAEVYVVKGKNGAVTFTSRKPASGKFSLFKPRPQAQFSTYRARSAPWRRGKLFKSRYDGAIARAAKRYGVDPHLVRAVIHAESAFNPAARSHKGAIGLMQLMPNTANMLGVNPWEPEQNITGGVKYLANLIDRYEGDLRRALAAYNAGPGAVDQFRGIPPYRETKNYVAKVLSLHQAYRSAPV